MRKVITISRQFGSGGREVAKKLAESLQIPYYDKSILAKIAQKTEFSEEYIDSIVENKGTLELALTYNNTFISTAYYSPIEEVQRAQREVLEHLAEKSDCVMVGRASNHILKDIAFKVFIYSSDMDKRIDRCFNKVPEDKLTVSRLAMEKRIIKIDKKRAKYNKIYSDEKWFSMNNYHLCIDTAKIDIDTAVAIIVEAVK
ncbi:MAG: cytidylate kinase-like family protein [Bacillota bacterium]